MTEETRRAARMWMSGFILGILVGFVLSGLLL